MLAVERMAGVAMVDDDGGQRLIDTGASLGLPRPFAPGKGRQPDRYGFRILQAATGGRLPGTRLQTPAKPFGRLLGALGAPRPRVVPRGLDQVRRQRDARRSFSGAYDVPLPRRNQEPLPYFLTSDKYT